MSNLSGPNEASAKAMNESRKAMDDWMGQGGSMTNPFVAHSAGAFAAATALGLAAASQWTGVMMGVMQGMMGQSAHGSEPQAVAARPAKAEKPVKAEQPVAEKRMQATEPAPAAKPVSAAKAEKPARVTSIAAVAKLKSDAHAAAEAVVEPSALAGPAAAPAVVAAPPAVAAPAAAAALEPEDFRRPAEIEKPGSPDDLKLIAGVGPKLEQVLNGLGVWTYAQIAAWSPAEVAWVDDYLQFKGRIGRDDWIAQAAVLASGGAEEYQKTFGKEPR